MEAMNKQKGVDGNLKSNVQMPQQTAEVQVPTEEGKMPFWKKWWFWTLIGAVVVILILVFYLL